MLPNLTSFCRLCYLTSVGYGTRRLPNSATWAPGIEICVENMLNCDIRSRRGIWGSEIGRYLPSEAASRLRSESHPRNLGPRAPSQASTRRGGSGRCPRKSASHPTSGTVAFFTSKHAGGARPSGAKHMCSASWLRRALTAL